MEDPCQLELIAKLLLGFVLRGCRSTVSVLRGGRFSTVVNQAEDFARRGVATCFQLGEDECSVNGHLEGAARAVYQFH